MPPPSTPSLIGRKGVASAAYDNLKSRGIEFVNAPHLVHTHADGVEEWMAFFKDPEGRTLAIMAQVSLNALPATP